MARPRTEAADERRQAIIKLFKSEDRPTLDEIGARFNVTKQYASLVLREAGLLAGESEHLDVSEIVAEILNLSGLTQTDVGVVLGVARESISRWLGGQRASTSRARQLRLLARGLKYAAENRVS
jgi:hypothetical protein